MQPARISMDQFLSELPGSPHGRAAPIQSTRKGQPADRAASERPQGRGGGNPERQTDPTPNCLKVPSPAIPRVRATGSPRRDIERPLVRLPPRHAIPPSPGHLFLDSQFLSYVLPVHPLDEPYILVERHATRWVDGVVTKCARASDPSTVGDNTQPVRKWPRRGTNLPLQSDTAGVLHRIKRREPLHIQRFQLLSSRPIDEAIRIHIDIFPRANPRPTHRVQRAVAVVNEDRSLARQHIVRVLRSTALPASLLVSAGFAFRWRPWLCVEIRGCCRRYCRQGSGGWRWRDFPLRRSLPGVSGHGVCG